MRTRRELLLLACVLRAQSPTFSTGTKVVNVLATVRDRDGRPVRNLTREDFELREDGRVQEIRYFSAETNLPLTIALLFDLSGSQRNVTDRQRQASLAFLRSVLRAETDQACLIGFNLRIDLLQPPTSSVTELEKSLDRVTLPTNGDSRGTRLFDALAFASSVLSDAGGRKALVVVSDGFDTSSEGKLDAAVEALQRGDILVYPIRFIDPAFSIGPRPRSLEEGQRILERIGKQTGGGYVETSQDRTLDDSFKRIEEELRNQYSLGFTPQARGRGHRRLRVSVKPRGLTVRARESYFASE